MRRHQSGKAHFLCQGEDTEEFKSAWSLQNISPSEGEDIILKFRGETVFVKKVSAGNGRTLEKFRGVLSIKLVE